jgi:hypothetical protein
LTAEKKAVSKKDTPKPIPEKKKTPKEKVEDQ